MASEPPKLFLSYNRSDRDWAEWIAVTLERAGYEPILQAWHFRPGENFVLRMQEAAAQTDFTIAVLSANYLKSEYTQPPETVASRASTFTEHCRIGVRSTTGPWANGYLNFGLSRGPGTPIDRNARESIRGNLKKP